MSEIAALRRAALRRGVAAGWWVATLEDGTEVRLTRTALVAAGIDMEAVENDCAATEMEGQE